MKLVFQFRGEIIPSQYFVILGFDWHIFNEKVNKKRACVTKSVTKSLVNLTPERVKQKIRFHAD